MTVSFEKISTNHELHSHILSFCSLEENVQTNTLVCRNWRNIASDVAKIQMIEQFQQNIQRNAANFLYMVPENLRNFASYCPSCAKLEEVKGNCREYPLTDVYDITHKNSLGTLEQYTARMRSFFRVHPDCPYIPAEKEDDLSGRLFVELDFKKDSQDSGETTYSIYLWKKPQFCLGNEEPVFFPIELFVKQENNMETYCFALGGRLIEVMLEKGPNEINSIEEEFGLFESSETEKMVQQGLYVPGLDAPAKSLPLK